MCHSLKVLTLLLITTYTNGQFSEEQQSLSYNHFYAPPTLNFNDIYTNSIAMLAEEPILTTSSKEDKEFHINIPTQFVEFQLPTSTDPPTTPTRATPPPPKYILSPVYLETTKTETTTTTTTTSTTTTEPPETSTLTVIRIKKEPQRGVLDLLFPANRVRTFKSVFDTFRRILSHTFK